MIENRKFYEFAEFQLDVDDKTLWRGKEKISLPLKAVEMLTLLVENRGRTVTKDEILEKLWQDTFVDENNLAVTISALRKAFGERKDENRFIETVPRRGYRFVAEAKVTNGNLILEKHTLTEITLEETERPKNRISRRNRNFAIFGLLMVALISFLVYSFWNSPNRNPEKTTVTITAPITRSIAVLPLRNLSNVKEQEQLSLGLTDALITKLASLKGLSVRPTSAVLAFAENPPTSQIVQEKLKVENYLEGTIQRVEKRLRVSLQLVKTADGSIIWAGSFDEAESDLLKLQDAISNQVVSALRFKISPQEQADFAKNGTENADAFELYLQGRYFWNQRSADNLKKAIEFFQKAIEKDGKFALAYSGMAESFQLLGEYGGLPTAEAFEKSRNSAKKALELNPNLAEAHSSLGYTLAFYDWNWQSAEKEFQRAIEINPNYATAHQWFGEYFISVGKFDEAYFQIKKAEELDPSSLVIKSNLAGYYYLTRQFDKSIEESEKILAIDPKFFYAYNFQWLSFEQKGETDKTFAGVEKIHSLFFPPEAIEKQRKIYQEKGWQAYWHEVFEKNMQPPNNKILNSFQIAMSALRAGEIDQTFALLEKSFQAHERWFVNLRNDPQWDKIRNDARFNELIKKANL